MGTRLAILSLIGVTLVELAVLPVHVVLFAIRRASIRREIRAMLEGSS